MQVKLYIFNKPTIFLAEMAPPDPAHNDPGEYTQLENGLTQIGFTSVTAAIVNMAEHEAYTDRKRYVVMATKTPQPFEFPEPIGRFAGFERIMMPADTVPPAMQAQHYKATKMPAWHNDGFRSKKIGTITRGDGSLGRHDQLQNRLYDPKFPMPTMCSFREYRNYEKK